MAGVITRLEVQKRNKERVNVYLNDQFAFGLAILLAARLRKGQTLSDSDITELQREDGVHKAYDRALNYLSYRPRSEQEIRQYLRGKAMADDQIDQILERLRRVGLVDDTAFAEAWVRNRAATKPRGARALRQELRLKGVAKPIVEEAIADLDEVPQALDAARPRALRLAALPAFEFRRKLGDFLLRRGFDYSVVREVVGQLWTEINGERMELDEEPD